MGKVMGVLCILAGACSGIAAWYFGRKEKIHRMEAILDFLRRTAEAVEQQTPMLQFLQSCPCRDALLARALKLTAQELTANQWELGELAWKAAILAAGGDGSIQYERKSWQPPKRNHDACSRDMDFGEDDSLPMHQWNLNREQWETLCEFGQIFDAGNRDAISELLYRQNRKWERYLEEEREQLVQQQRVVLPMGMLSGVMLVLLLI